MVGGSSKPGRYLLTIAVAVVVAAVLSVWVAVRTGRPVVDPPPGSNAVGPFAGCDVGDTTVTDAMTREHWDPVTSKKWQFPGTEIILAEAGVARLGPRRPFEYAILSAGPAFGSVQVEAWYE